MPSANGFYWYIKDPLYVSVQDDLGKQPRTKIAYKMRYKDKSDIPYIEVPAGGYKNIIFRLEDVLERIKGDNRDQVLQGDLDKGWFQCKIWNNDGREISKGNLVLEADEIPLVQCLLPPQSTLDHYAKQWIQSFRDAVEVAAEALSIEELGGWDVLSRFFCPSKGVTFQLGLFPSEGLDITQQDIDTVKKAYKGHMGVEPIILCFHCEAELERNGWFKFSSNPLGMYTTWVHGDDKDRLEEAELLQ